jgi:exonuclease 1
MGISGLLPLLKSIQNTKHLSELSGQTIAVDAYVWLHRGIFTCATELATGKDTTKYGHSDLSKSLLIKTGPFRYVEYAMQRVRLLRHHRIHPYIVFDGGPLPAKQHTEVERKKRREDNLAQGNALAAQGKHSQAREYYVKCIDVTPQMAFQFIKVYILIINIYSYPLTRRFNFIHAVVITNRLFALRTCPTLLHLTKPMRSLHISSVWVSQTVF